MPASPSGRFFTADVRKQLQPILDALPHPVEVWLVAGPGDNQEEVQVARDLMAGFQDLSRNVRLREFKPADAEIMALGVDRSPAMMFAPENYRIAYLGVPLGEEGRTLVEAIILLGLGASQLNEQAARVIDRIDSPRKIRVFVSPTCPYCPQQAVNAVKAAIQNPGQIRTELVDIHFNPDLAEQYSAMSVPQTWANDVLIAQGAQPQELFAASLEKMEEQHYFIPESDAPVVETDLVIVGGGPAGLTAGIYAARSGLKAVIVEKDALGGQVATTPVVENYPGLAHVGGRNLVDIMVGHALEYVQIFPREAVMDIQPGQPMEITTTLRRFKARAVLLATGAVHRRLGVPGEDRLSGRGVSYCATCDGPLFAEKKVAMIGGGNSALTEALHLHQIGVQVAMIHRRDAFRAQESLVRDLESKNIPVVWNTEVREIRGREKVEELALRNRETGEESTLGVDGVFVSIGYSPQTELAARLGVETTPDGYIREDGRHRTNVPGLYSAGDVEGGYKQIVTAAGAGAGASMTIFEDLVHPYWRDESRHQAP